MSVLDGESKLAMNPYSTMLKLSENLGPQLLSARVASTRLEIPGDMEGGSCETWHLGMGGASAGYNTIE